MKAHPILFSGEMIRALLDGRKSQTRRIVKPQPPAWMEVVNRVKHFPFGGGDMVDSHLWQWCESEKNPPRRLDRWPVNDMGDDYAIPCPHGKPGDLLWVRETFWPWKGSASGKSIIYCADGSWYDWGRTSVKITKVDPASFYGPKKPSIFMPRWASRLTLRITDVRVERLQEIVMHSEDCFAEGILWDCDAPMIGPCEADAGDLIEQFSTLWDRINGAGSWSSSPWVWTISFEVIHKNIDEVML